MRCMQDADMHHGLARRQLKDAPAGYVLVSSTSGSRPADVRALANNISAALVSMQPTIYTLCHVKWPGT